jgi:hypothetical protein
MADGKKKKKSSEKKKSATPQKATSTSTIDEVAAVEAGQLHSPWLPLVWILVPLFACIVYGVLTRGH